MNSSTPKSASAFTMVEIMVVVVIIGLLAAIAIPAFLHMQSTSQDKAVLNNARQLAAAADQYMMETGKSTVPYVVLVGPTSYVKVFSTIANEVYPTNFTQGVPITVQGVAGVRTITYGF